MLQTKKRKTLDCAGSCGEGGGEGDLMFWNSTL